MSSDNEYSDSEVLSSSTETLSSSDSESEVTVSGPNQPYQDEPLARDRNRTIVEDGVEENDTDEDGLSPAVLEARYLEEVPVQTWYVAVYCL